MIDTIENNRDELEELAQRDDPSCLQYARALLKIIK